MFSQKAEIKPVRLGEGFTAHNRIQEISKILWQLKPKSPAEGEKMACGHRQDPTCPPWLAPLMSRKVSSASDLPFFLLTLN